ncbi:IS982 family transposase, partial [Corynebacterium halotolerans]
TALYVATDDYLNTHPDLLPVRPPSGFPPQISDAELIVLAIMETLLGFTSERRFVRYAHKHLTSIFPYLPQQSGYHKRQRTLTVV